MQSSRRKKPDWNEFYRNGVPKEVIVIDDDSPPPQSSKNAAQVGKSVSDLTYPYIMIRVRSKLPSQNPSYSTTQTPYYENTSSNQTASTDRTTSAYNTTTAATSLGSQASNGTYAAYDDAAAVGQKRKRTRVAAEDTSRATKRREVRTSPYSDYRPPPHPPIKAKDVYVEVVPDRSYMKDLKVDDDDGHYIVHPDSDLTERCE